MEEVKGNKAGKAISATKAKPAEKPRLPYNVLLLEIELMAFMWGLRGGGWYAGELPVTYIVYILLRIMSPAHAIATAFSAVDCSFN